MDDSPSGLIQLAVGLSLGLAGAMLVGSVMDSMLVGITPGDPMTFAAITTLLTIVCSRLVWCPRDARPRSIHSRLSARSEHAHRYLRLLI